MVIRRAVELKGFKWDYKFIKKRLVFSITKTRLTKIVSNLLNLKLLGQKGQKLFVSKGQVEIESDLASEAAKNFHISSLNMAKKSLEILKSSEREFQSLILNFSSEDLPDAKEEIRNFIKEFNEKFGKNQGDQVSQLNVNFFPYYRDFKKGE